MAQIVTTKVHSDRCNLTAIEPGGSKAETILAVNEVWLVDTTNSDKGIKGYGKYDSYIIGDGITPASELPVTIIDDLSSKLDVLTFDTTPTPESTNPVTSNGIKSALDTKSDKSNTYTKLEVNNLIIPHDSDLIFTSDHTSISDPLTNTIYREYGESSYSDWAYNGSTWLKLAEYDNLLDNVPVKDSENLTKSGGIYNAINDTKQTISRLKVDSTEGVYPAKEILGTVVNIATKESVTGCALTEQGLIESKTSNKYTTVFYPNMLYKGDVIHFTGTSTTDRAHAVGYITTNPNDITLVGTTISMIDYESKQGNWDKCYEMPEDGWFIYYYYYDGWTSNSRVFGYHANDGIKDAIGIIDNSVIEISNKTELLELDNLLNKAYLYGGSYTSVISGKTSGIYSTVSNNTLMYKPSTDVWEFRNHDSVKEYIINIQGNNYIKIEGSVYCNKQRANDGPYTKWASVLFRKSTPWIEVPEDYTNIGLVGSYYYIALTSTVVTALKTSSYVIEEIPEEAEQFIVSLYYNSSHPLVGLPINITKNNIINGLNNNVEDLKDADINLDTRVTALEEGGIENLVTPDTNNDLDTLMLRKYIIDNYSYYITTPTYPISYDDMNYLDGKIKSVPEGKHFIFVTDVHWADNPSKLSNYIASYVQKRLGGCTVIFGGDVVNSPATTVVDGQVIHGKYRAARELSIYNDLFFSAFGDNCLWVCGNHEGNYVEYNSEVSKIDNSGNNKVSTLYVNLIEDTAIRESILEKMSLSTHIDYTSEEISAIKTVLRDSCLLDDTEIYKRSVARLAHKVTFDEQSLEALNALETVDVAGSIDMTDELKALGEAWIKLHYYYDDVKNKIRYIVFETGNAALAINKLMSYATSYKICLQYRWFYNVLMSTPDDYDIVVLGHEWALNGTNGITDDTVTSMFRMIWYFLNKGECQINHKTQNTTECTKTLPRALTGLTTSANRTYKFLGNTFKGRIIVLGGHYHRDVLYQFLYLNSSWVLTAMYPTPSTPPTINEKGIIYAVINTDNGSKGRTKLGEYKMSGGSYDIDPITGRRKKEWHISNGSDTDGLDTPKKWRGNVTLDNNGYITSVSSLTNNVEEVCFDVVTITSDNKVVFTRFGWGENREANIPIWPSEE